MDSRAPVPDLVGRGPELDRVRAWLELMGSGPAGLLIDGEAGIGKTTIWDAAVAAASGAGVRVLITRPVEAELPLGYAGLGDLFGVAADSVLDKLPEPQARALSAALSLGAEPEPGDPLLVGRATLAALQGLSARSPIVIAIDDVQWLDPPSARALGFAARRLDDARVGFVASIRSGHGEPIGIGDALGDRTLDLQVSGLSLGAIGHLLRSRVDPNIGRRTLARVHERSAGNPFFAIQLARAGEGSLPSSLAKLVRGRLDAISPVAATALELVAVLGPLPVGAFADLTALDAAVTSGVLVEQDDRVRFAHPLLAAGAYERIPPGRRQTLHRHAAGVAGTIEERARHLALATASPDVETAELLEDAARAARARGAPETAADLAAQARRLTPVDDREALARRTMDQADYLVLAADEPGARVLVDQLLAGPTEGTTRVRALVQAALFEADPRAGVARMEEAVAQPHGDRKLAARTLAQLAWQRGAWLGDIGPAIGESLVALDLAETVGDDTTLVAALTTAGLLASLDGHPTAAGQFQRALEIIGRVPTAAGDHTPRLAFAHERWWRGDFAAAEVLLADERRRAEQHGDDGLLMRLDIFGAEFAMRRGHWGEADRLLEDALAVARDYWRVMALVRRAILRARRGDRAALVDADEIRASPVADADPVIGAAADFATGLIDLAEGRVTEAGDRMIRLPESSDRSGSSRGLEFADVIPETVGVLVEGGRVDQADAITRQLERRHGQLDPWGSAAVALCRGLLALAAGDAGAALGRLAVAASSFEGSGSGSGSPWELAQTRLAEGMVLRRMGRRREAAAALEQAAALFADLGAEPALRRTADELRRARPRPRRDDSLTAAETRVAALVAAGSTNREVAARLFTTVATVEAHLTRIYSKLGVRSRTELTRRVSDGSLRLDEEFTGEPPT